MKYHLITYGCQMNTADSEEMAQPLKDRGFIQTLDPEQADIILMNTCTVRDQAEHRADSNLGRLRPWKEANPNRILIVAGCAASRWGESIRKKYSFIDLVSPATKIEEFPAAVAEVLKGRWNWDREQELASPASRVPRLESLMKDTRHGTQDAGPDSNPFGDDSTAYVTIMRGCNYSCSYCIVPQVRGREVYRPMPEILREIERKVAEGFKEVMLLGQTVNSYYYRSPASRVQRPAPTTLTRDSGLGTRDEVLDFSDLLRAVNAIDGIDRIRFMSPHPRHMRENVIRAMAESSKVCRHIHLPLQSGSDRLLRDMKRLYTREEYKNIVLALRKAIPGIKITTDVIVGYPSESDADFRDSLSLMEDMRFDGLFAFKFSPRPGTAAAEQADDVSENLKEHRLQQVLTLNKRIREPLTPTLSLKGRGGQNPHVHTAS